MANRRSIVSSSRFSKSASSSDVRIHIGEVPFNLDRNLLAAKSAKLAGLLKENPAGDISCLLQDIPADPGTFELVVRFCHGLEVGMSAENVVPLSCLAYHLGMTEQHSPNNLLKMALAFMEHRVIPCWNESVKALRSAENILQQAVQLGVVDACAQSIIAKALDNPRLLGEPTNNLVCNDDRGDNENDYRPNVKRRLFVLDKQSEDLTTLSLQLYEPIIRAMILRQVRLEYVAASLYQYAKKWIIFSNTGEDMVVKKMNSQKEVIEAVERLLPEEGGLLPCSSLFEMLRFALALEASSNCINGLELRIGKQLDQATVNDLLVPCQGYAKEARYDVESLRRILKNFYCNYTHPDTSGLNLVAALIEDFLAEAASDKDLKMTTFISLAELSISASVGTQRSNDGIYRAIDIYLDRHKYLTESEREEVCQVLDCHKMSTEACEHAAQNERLPLRMVVQVLFVGQLQLRDTITKEAQGSEEKSRELKKDAEVSRIGHAEDEVTSEMEKMGMKVMELERECSEMRKEIRSRCCNGVKKEKGSMWKEMKRKFGCMGGVHDCNCHVKKKKVHPR